MDWHLRHPKHGEKVAHSEAEVKADKENGWEEFTPGEPAVPAFLSVTPSPEDAAELAKVKAELEKVKADLKEAKADLKEAKADAKKAETELAKVKAELAKLAPAPTPPGVDLGALVNPPPSN